MEIGLLASQLRARGELRIRVKVVPKSSRSQVAGFMADGTLKVRIQSPPEKGKANDELCSLLAQELNVSPRNVEIIRGQTSSLKHVRVVL